MEHIESVIKGVKYTMRIRRSKAISVVLTTMIILVASVVLATGVVIYGTSLFQTGAQQESIAIQGVTLWVHATNSTGTAWGAAGVRNSGDKLVSVDNIQIRGAAMPFTQWFIEKNQTALTTENFQSQYEITTMDLQNGLLTNGTGLSGFLCNGNLGIFMLDYDDITGSNPTLCFTKASGPTSLTPGQKLIVYFRVNPGLLQPVDSGTPTNVGIFAGKTGAPITAIITNP